jgi:acetyl esterase/lipase
LALAVLRERRRLRFARSLERRESEKGPMHELHHRQPLAFVAARFHVVVLTTVCLAWSAVGAEEYKYPYRDPYLATVTSAILNADDGNPRIKRQLVQVPGLPDRNHLPSLEGRGEVRVTLYRHHRPAPLLFILSGVGSNPYFGLATYFARLFYQEGLHIVVLPSPMTWNFALAASRSGAPGYVPEDARDLYEVMQKTLWVLKTRYDVKITEINFLGASLGALEGAHLSVIDADEKKIGIAKYLLVNPPLDLSHALEKIDEWDGLQSKFGRKKSKGLLGKALAIVESFARDRRDDPATFEKFAKAFAGFTREELQFLIAEDVHALLPELIYVTQVVHDRNLLRVPKDQVRARIEEAKYLTFLDYSEKIALPLWRLQAGEPEADLETFNRRGSLAAVLERLRGNPRVHVIHNADDVLADRRSIEELKETLGDQMTLYPYGGHLGNLWYPENKKYILSLFKRPF